MNKLKVCIIVPIYNHSAEFASVAEQLNTLNIPCLIVDDGSDATNASALTTILQPKNMMTLLRLPQNGGKGVAVCKGLNHAYQQGFTHALQVDADGQHNIADIQQFIDNAKQAPSAVITGKRIYVNAPKSRQYGRKFTDLWVHINTLSFTASDSMCGFRLYPLAETIPLINKTHIGRRMDFDSEILVKLIWEGLSIKEVETRVIYKPDITSHFDVLHDNIAISLMHTRLFFGMLPRLPRLLRRKFRVAN